VQLYSTVVPSHATNKRENQILKFTKYSQPFVCVMFDVEETRIVHRRCCVMHCPTYHTDKQYKVKIDSSGGRYSS
jgi:hypothetical protein